MRLKILGLGLALMASGCGEASGDEREPQIAVERSAGDSVVTVRWGHYTDRLYAVDGPHGVPCVAFQTYKGGGISCDFPPAAIEVAHTDSGEVGE